jgi:hypothetical protein
VNFNLKEDRFKVLSVWNISSIIFVAVHLIDIRLNDNADIGYTKYPNAPLFYNYLSVAYGRAGDRKKCESTILEK